jgi:predicted phage tail protein
MHKSNLAPQGADVMESLIEVKLLGELGRRFRTVIFFRCIVSLRKSFQRCLNQIEGFKEYLRQKLMKMALASVWSMEMRMA